MNSKVYLDKLLDLKKNFSIKLISGFRGTGKLELLKMFAENLKIGGVDEEQIIFINFETDEHLTDFQKLYSYVNEKIENLDYAYLIFYEIHYVEEWEKAVNAFFLGAPVEIYIADSNEKFLTEKLLHLLPDNCDVMKMYPLEFSEYVKSVSVDATSFDLEEINEDNLLNKYLTFGGMPISSNYPVDENILQRLLGGLLYESVLKDVTIRYSVRNSYLFQYMLKFLALNLGEHIRIKSLEDYLSSLNIITTSFTIENYLNLIVESGFFKKVFRYDLKKDTFVNGGECYYCIDNGICNALLNFDCSNETALIKNVVYLELLRKGYDVYCAIVGKMTADFFAVSNDKKICIQILPTDGSIKPGKLLRPLHKLSNDIEKFLISKNPIKIRGDVKNITVKDFLLHGNYC